MSDTQKNHILEAPSDKSSQENISLPKPEQLPKPKKKTIIIGVLSVSGLLAGGLLAFALFRHHENTKPVGNDIKIVTETKGETAVPTAEIQKTVEVVSGKKLNDRGFDMLWQARVPQVDNGKGEYPDPIQFRGNLIELLKSRDAKDINQAAALWTRNRLNFSFTENESLSAAALGHDALLVDRYMTLVDGVAMNGRTKQDIKLARQINDDFQSPWAMAIYGSSLQIKATAELVTDRNSVQTDMYLHPIREVTIRQFDEDSLDQATMIEYATGTETGPMGGQKFNKVQQAWNSMNKPNRVYEVHVSDIKRTAIVVLTEDTSGDLKVYGTYFAKIQPTDALISVALNDNVVGAVNNSEEDPAPQNWEQFEAQVEEYFGN